MNINGIASLKMTNKFLVNTFNYIGVKDEEALLKESKYLSMWDINHRMFYEPDISSHTAIATHPLRGKERNRLKHYELKQ